MTYAANLNTYLNPTPQTILRKGNYGVIHYEEFPCHASYTPPYPGMLVQINSDGTCSVQTSVGGDVPVMVAVEDALQGHTIDDQYSANNIVRVLIAEPGHMIQGPIPVGVATVVGSMMLSKGDGRWTPQTGLAYTNLYVSNSNSNTVTNTTAQTSFGQTYSIPAASLVAGDILTIVAQGIAPSTNSTDTLNVALKIGSTTVCTTGAVDVTNNDVFHITATVVVRSAGASGSLVAAGSTVLGAAGTATEKVFALTPTTVNTNAALTVDVLATWSVASTSNQVQMNILSIERTRSQRDKPLGMAMTALNNVAGTGYEFVDILVF